MYENWKMIINAKVHTTQEGSRPVSQERRLLWLTEEPGHMGGRAAKCSAVFLGVCSVTPTHPSVPWETGASHTASACTFEHTSVAFPPLLEGSRDSPKDKKSTVKPPYGPHSPGKPILSPPSAPLGSGHPGLITLEGHSLYQEHSFPIIAPLFS